MIRKLRIKLLRWLLNRPLTQTEQEVQQEYAELEARQKNLQKLLKDYYQRREYALFLEYKRQLRQRWLWGYVEGVKQDLHKMWEKHWEKHPLAFNRKKFAKQEDCQHLKGATMYPWGWDKYRSDRRNKDYNLRHHRYIDFSQDIRCLTCGKIWLPTDSDWSKALEMLEQSTNSVTTTEAIMFRVERNGKTIAHEPFQSRESLLKKYPNAIFEPGIKLDTDCVVFIDKDSPYNEVQEVK